MQRSPTDCVPLLRTQLSDVGTTNRVPGNYKPGYALAARRKGTTIRRTVRFLHQRTPLTTLNASAPTARTTRTRTQSRIKNTVKRRKSSNDDRDRQLRHCNTVCAQDNRGVTCKSHAKQRIIVSLVVSSNMPSHNRHAGVFSPR